MTGPTALYLVYTPMQAIYFTKIATATSKLALFMNDDSVDTQDVIGLVMLALALLSPQCGCRSLARVLLPSIVPLIIGPNAVIKIHDRIIVVV